MRNGNKNNIGTIEYLKGELLVFISINLAPASYIRNVWTPH